MIICDSMESEDNSTTTESFRLTSDEVQRLDEVSSIDKRSRSGMLRKIVVDYLEAVEV
jgi:predicted DNA-binding protein